MKAHNCTLKQLDPIVSKWIVCISFSLFFLLLLLGITGTAAEHPYPLEPPDTSSPRATLQSFMTIMNDAISTYLEAQDSERAKEIRVGQLLAKAVRCLDLRDIAPTIADRVAYETTLLLFDVLNRIDMPPDEEIPNAAFYEDDKPERFPRWTIPRTEITISRVEEGPRSGEFLFSPDTVARAKAFYNQIRHLPPHPNVLMHNVYEGYLRTSGWMIPMQLTERLPGWLKARVLEQAIWEWVALIVLLVLGGFIITFISRWTHRKTREASPLNYLLRLVVPVSVLLLLPGMRYLVEKQLTLAGIVEQSVLFFMTIVFFFAAAWVIWLISSGIAELIIASPRIHPESLDAHLVRLVAHTFGIASAVFIILYGARDLGLPVFGLLASLGIGGLALALAAQHTIENFIGALTLYSDRPIRVGDFCRVGDKLGTVENIGLRSTRLRGLDRTVTTIPNAEFSRMEIVNLSRRDQMLLRTILGLRYETRPDQLRFVLAKLRELLLAHPNITDEPIPARARFAGFGDYSLNIELFAYIDTSNWAEFLAIQEDVFLRIASIIEEAGTGFAFPSHTTYHARDGGLDQERVAAAEAEVQHWRSAGTLPFPEFTEEHQQQVRNTLDFPPLGSPATGPLSSEKHEGRIDAENTDT